MEQEIEKIRQYDMAEIKAMESDIFATKLRKHKEV